jgi:8-oxo-dGTP pyrophosphatase MutT (NUDIX family)
MLIRRMSIPLEGVVLCTPLTVVSEIRTLRPVDVRSALQDVVTREGERGKVNEDRAGFRRRPRRFTVRNVHYLHDRDSMTIRQAAVAIVLSAATMGDELLLVRRATVDGDPWSGHLALPGGRREPVDATLEDTARRETLEETGIDLSRSMCTARLTPVTPSSMAAPAITIAPFVFRYEGDRGITMSCEIVESWWIPVEELRREEAWTTTPVTIRDGSARQVRGFPWHGHVLWGLTERIIYEFLATVKQGQPL